jgi:cardiolipin synthase (CMP-forming)
MILRGSILNVPNVITLVRLGLVPVTAYFVWREMYGPALITFLSAALSDMLDGLIARGFNQSSRLGAALDPVADKLVMFVVTVTLAAQGLLPLWLACAVVLRDVIIVAGAIAYRAALGHIEIAPTMLSKLNTFLEFGVLLLVMADAAGWIAAAGFFPAVFVVVFVTVVASGMQYVWVWSRKAVRDSGHSLK